MLRRPFPSICAAFLALTGVVHAETLLIQGSSTVAQVLSTMVPEVKRELGIDLKLSTEGGSTVGFLALGAGVVNLAMSTRPIEASDRAQYPEKEFQEIRFGSQVLVMAVPDDVWDAGVHALSKEQMRSIYEGSVRNWKALGGPDTAIKLYNPERGHGVWELFVTWIYGDQRKAGLGQAFETVSNDQDARDSVEFNAGSIAVISPKYADGKGVHALAIKGEQDPPLEPTAEALKENKYPIARPLLLLSDRRMVNAQRRLADYLLSERGQAAVAKAGFVPLKGLPAAPVSKPAAQDGEVKPQANADQR